MEGCEMKIEFEIDEQIMGDAIREHVARMIRERSGWYSTKDDIKTLIGKYWAVESEKAVREALKDLPAIEQMARECLAKKVESQLKKLMK